MEIMQSSFSPAFPFLILITAVFISILIFRTCKPLDKRGAGDGLPIFCVCGKDLYFFITSSDLLAKKKKLAASQAATFQLGIQRDSGKEFCVPCLRARFIGSVYGFSQYSSDGSFTFLSIIRASHVY